jgi:hypothetical protein
MPTNVEQNETLWNNYARDWGVDKKWIKQMIEDNQRGADADKEGFVLGEEWSDKTSLEQTLVRN